MKTQQSYKNHVRFYIPHHFIFYPVLLLLLGIAVYFSTTSHENAQWVFITIAFTFIFILSFMLRQHYALILQNRIVKLEFKYTYFTLTGKRFEQIENTLTDSQVFALRFASDEELLELIKKAQEEHLSAKEIKKAIKNWKPDNQRV